MKFWRFRLVKVKPRVPRGHYKKHRKYAEGFVRLRVRELSERYGFEYNKVVIRNQTTRWGSCSRKKNLSFNYKIIFLSPELQDYLILHELCHLKELNHSKRFWALMGQLIPKPKQMRKALRNVKLNL